MRSLFVALVAAAVAAQTASGAAPETTRFFRATEVNASFAKSGALVEADGYKIHTSRRDAPGIVEIHAKDTDIFYLLDGSATFVTGGTAVGQTNTAPGEIRAKEIKGGESRRVGKGDIIIVPTGVPHQFKEVNGPLLYYVVKVTK